MIVGNTQAQEVFTRYIERIRQDGVIPFPFLLLHGPQHVGKTTLVEETIRPWLAEHLATDYLPAYDLSELLEKKHIFKVEVPPKEQLLEIDGKRYIDKGTRDIVSWLSIAPVGQWKVVFLENIERMNGAAANAFLKTLEEPLPGRLIIATTSHREQLLDTIVSRAFLISFQLPSLHELMMTLEAWKPAIDEKTKAFIASFSLGRLGYVKRLLEQAEGIADQIKAFDRLIYLLETNGSLVEQYKILQRFAQQGSVEHLIDAVLYRFDDGQFTAADRWLTARRLLTTNVGQDNILFDLALPG